MRIRIAGLLVIVSTTAVFGAAGQRALTLSPGEPGRATVIEGRCPTFSWNAVAGSESYELVVYEFSEEPLVAAAGPALRRVLPGGAFSWTPGRSDCFAAGRSYAWFVRAVGRGVDAAWSEERLFTTEAEREVANAVAALEVLQLFLSEGGELADLVESASPGMEAHLAESVQGEPIASAATLQMSTPRSDDEKQVGAAIELPEALAPLPFGDLGISSSSSTTRYTSSASTRSLWVDSTGDKGPAVGYLGVAVADTNNGDFDGFPQLKGLRLTQIGVLGFNSGDDSTGYGVVGVGMDGGHGGHFYNADAAGERSNQVFLGGRSRALNAIGPIGWDCPDDMDRVGTWCIDKVASAPATARTSVDNCDNRYKSLCPLAAIMTCDQVDTRNSVTNSCGHNTDTAGQSTRTFSIDNDPVSSSAWDKFVTYAASGNTLSVNLGSDEIEYFCCRPVSP